MVAVMAAAMLLYVGIMANLSRSKNANTDARGCEDGDLLNGRVAPARGAAGARRCQCRHGLRSPTRFCCLFRFSAGIEQGLLDRGDSTSFIPVRALIAPLTKAYTLWAGLPAWRRSRAGPVAEIGAAAARPGGKAEAAGNGDRLD